MSDLSWLNPTPHTIAVYASSPLSPAATQHSLPSGRYPLLGPDFHRLDRTSLRLAHSLDHLVAASEQGRRNFQAEHLGSGQVDDEVELGRLLNRDVGWLRPAQNLVDIVGGAPEHVRPICSIRHQTACFDGFPDTVHRRQSRA